MDAGMSKTHSILDFIFLNGYPENDEALSFWTSQLMCENQGANVYSASGLGVIQSPAQKGIVVRCFIGDGLSFQLSGFFLESRDSIQKGAETGCTRNILYRDCSCHLLNLAVAGALNDWRNIPSPLDWIVFGQLLG
jgi:hypothetical protein